uniref:Uncharacterized protein n=1 Tax=Anguilla anguilla TaxID=7936 RepID=A0A0E9RM78_ANGAN
MQLNLTGDHERLKMLHAITKRETTGNFQTENISPEEPPFI